MNVALLWSAVSSRVAGPVASTAALVLAVFLAVALVGQATQEARARRLEKDRDTWRTTSHRWQATARRFQSAFEKSEALRARESARAVVAAEGARRACDTRIAAARRSARAIEAIVTKEVARDANNCPARGLVPLERLRDALAPVR